MDLSPLVADLYREWHRQRGINDNHLLVESFILIAPFEPSPAALYPSG
jgi:hypothetical protein